MIGRWLTRIVLVLGFVLAVSAPAAAATYDVHSGIDCAHAADSAVCQTTSTADPLTGSTGIIHNVTRLLALVAGAVAVIVMVIAGISYITSNGEADAVSRAKKTIIFAAIGLVVIVLAQSIINYVISKA